MPRPRSSRTSAAATFVTDGATLPDTVPARKPKSARLVGVAAWSWGPGSSRSDRYYISGDRTRRHWLLWLELEGEPEPAVIAAWCLRQGLSQHQAALLLLRTFWVGEDTADSVAQLGAPGYLSGAALLSTAGLRQLAKTIWPGEVA